VTIAHLNLQDTDPMQDRHTICRLPRSLDKTTLKETYDIFLSDPETTLYQDLEDAINFSTLEDLDDLATRVQRFQVIDSYKVVAPSEFQNPVDRLLAASAFGDNEESRAWVRDYFFLMFSEALSMDGEGIFYAIYVPTIGGMLLVRSNSVETASRASRDGLARLRRVFSKTMFGNIPNQSMARW